MLDNFFTELLSVLKKVETKVDILLSEQKRHTELEEYPDFLSREQVSSILGVSRITVDRYSREGKLKKYRNGKAVRFKKIEVLNTYKSLK